MENREGNGEQQVRAEQSGSNSSAPAGNTAPSSDWSAPKGEDPDCASLRDVRAPTDGDTAAFVAYKEVEAEDDDDDSITKPSGEASSCPYCDASYTTENRLLRHLKDEETKCFKDRVARGEDKIRYGCSRCHAQMSKKYSIERHIKDSCWKVCDECCAAGVPKCDAHYTGGGGCTPCEKEGRSCTKHTGPVSNCNAKLQTGSVHLPPTKPRRAGAPLESQRAKRKREAAASSELSPESRPVNKRLETTVEQEQATEHREKKEKLQAWKQTLENSQIFHPPTMRRQPPREPFPQEPSTESAYMPSFNCQQRGPGAQYNGIGRPTPLSSKFPYMQRQQQGYRGMTTAFQKLPSHNTSRLGMDSSAPSGFMTNDVFVRMPSHGAYDSRSFNPSAIDQNTLTNSEAMKQLQQQQFPSRDMLTRHDAAPGSGYLPLPPIRDLPPVRSHTPVQKPRPVNFNDVHSPQSRLKRFRPNLSSGFKIHGDSCGPVRRAPFIASAPGSRMPSRETTTEPVEDERAPSRMPPYEKLLGMNRLPRTVAKEPVARDLTQPISLQRSMSPSSEHDSILRLRIHTNKYDVNSTAIFSILTMRASQKFGHVLDAYCQHRNKEYGKDWVFIYRYALGDPNDPNNSVQEKYIPITYDMTPNDIHDNDVKLRDLDTIVVMKARSPLTARVESGGNSEETSPLSPLGSQLSQEDVNIMNGETCIYQNATVVDQYYKMCEQAMLQLRKEKSDLEFTTQLQQLKIEQQENAIKTLEMRNGQLMQNNIHLRHASRPQTVVRTSQRQQPAPQPAGRQFPIPGMGYGPGPTAITRPVPPPKKPTAFMARLEAAREPVQRTTPQKDLQPFAFPTQQGNAPSEPVQRRSSRERMQQFRFPIPERDGLATSVNNGSSAFDGGKDISAFHQAHVSSLAVQPLQYAPGGGMRVQRTRANDVAFNRQQKPVYRSPYADTRKTGGEGEGQDEVEMANVDEEMGDE